MNNLSETRCDCNCDEHIPRRYVFDCDCMDRVRIRYCWLTFPFTYYHKPGDNVYIFPICQQCEEYVNDDGDEDVDCYHLVRSENMHNVSEFDRRHFEVPRCSMCKKTVYNVIKTKDCVDCNSSSSSITPAKHRKRSASKKTTTTTKNIKIL